MIRAMLWKEWHENRAKFLFYWFAVNAPMLVVILAVGFSSAARTPFTDLSDALTMKYLPLSLIETLLVPTLFLILTGYLAVATLSPEADDRSLFFFFEQPISRRKYLAIKLLNGVCHVLLATSFAVLFMPVAAYVMMLLSGKVTVAGSGAAFGLVMGAAARAAIWCGLISVAGFTTSALVSAVVPRWWLGAACSVIVTILLISVSGDFFNFFPDVADNSMSVGMSVSTGNAQWVTISRAVTSAELKAFGQWRPWPLLTALLVIAACGIATTFLYDRKELK